MMRLSTSMRNRYVPIHRLVISILLYHTYSYGATTEYCRRRVRDLQPRSTHRLLSRWLCQHWTRGSGCTVVSAEFLAHQKRVGNDLSTPVPEYGFPGLKPGDRWAVCAGRWQQAINDGVPTGVVLAATNEAAAPYVSIEALLANSMGVPSDPSSLL